jgi:DNA polymerase-3 subunit gamma/tau
MENYIVSARKYRPATFDSVVGQQALTTTLKNAIANHKLAHAYLFCGPRGVGKTTCARIFAKTINCLHPKENGEACNECESCVAFNEQRSFNIHEMDAASNNGVDEMRNLIEQVQIPPQIGQYSVYIIDEVHMLSQNAFNAFLKTLEEPPHYAIFILATTEKHKIIPTILSRCQVYDFNRMSVNDMVEHLKYVAKSEGVEAEPEALEVIAQKADGGMRDALSIFDQVVSFTNAHVTYQDTIANLNVLDYEYYFKFTDAILKNEVTDCMLMFNEILKKGFDSQQFINGLGSHFRNLLVSRDAATLPLLEVSDAVRARYQEQAQRCPQKFLYRAMKLCNECDLNYRASKNKRFLVELTLIQVAQITQEDADEVGGRRPTKRLKPLFKLLAARVAAGSATSFKVGVANVNGNASASAGDAGNANTGNNAVANGNVQEAAGTYGVNLTRSGTPLPETPNEGKKIPTMKINSFNLSIKRKDETVPSSQAQANSETEVATSASPAEAANVANPQVAAPIADRPLAEQELSFHWFEFANLLPQEENALANRMKNMRLAVLDANTFEAIVDNDLVEKYLQGFSGRIEQHLRNALHNRQIKMQVRVSAPKEVVRAFSRKEQFEMMKQKNPELQHLINAFQLQFD